ncbi:hypothetical protein [Streptomyces sp. AS02]|uniref:hypothetical protein n=1 Tax=Streptomyces sp. AS02 TaxID=2938946 RepID=UPI0024C342BB|nr:hypothetical protein [Streptomyces sp. AS02]
MRGRVRAEVVGALLQGEDETVVVVADRRGPPEELDIGVRRELLRDGGDPVGGGRSAQEFRPPSNEPPGDGSSSTTPTRAPAREAVRAANSPAGPAPTTSTSQWECTVS